MTANAPPTPEPHTKRAAWIIWVECPQRTGAHASRADQGLQACAHGGIAHAEHDDQRKAKSVQEPKPTRPMSKRQSSKPSSWILRVMVLRPMPSFCAASTRRPPVAAKAAKMSCDSRVWVMVSHTLGSPRAKRATASC